MYNKFKDDIFVHSSLIKKMQFFVIMEYRETTLRSPYDVIDDIIAMKIFFPA